MHKQIPLQQSLLILIFYLYFYLKKRQAFHLWKETQKKLSMIFHLNSTKLSNQVVNYLSLAVNSQQIVLFLFYLQLRLQCCAFVVSISSCLVYNSPGRNHTLGEEPLDVLQSQLPCQKKKQGCYRGLIHWILLFISFYPYCPPSPKILE